MKKRKILEQIEAGFSKTADKQIIFIWGPRQIGKSTILNYLREKYGGAYFNFDDLDDQKLFTPSLLKLKQLIEFRSKEKKSRFVFIDEVQKNPESTQAIKLLTDTADYLVVATGSSELRAKTNYFDTLAGRYKEFLLFPLTIDETAHFKDESFSFLRKPNAAETHFLSSYLEEMMIYGSYPRVVLSKNKIEELKNITQNSIVKDIVNIYDLKNTDLVYNLLRLLAMQTGNLVNVSEVASSLKSTKVTIDNYLSILSKNRIIFFLEPYRTNKRRGYLERKKVFFYDLGVRNTLVEDFRPINLRPDAGAVFENLIIASFLRQIYYRRNSHKLYFYREIAGARKEIDLITETPAGIKTGYEIKSSEGEINKFPELGISGYKIISKENAPAFLV